MLNRRNFLTRTAAAAALLQRSLRAAVGSKREPLPFSQAAAPPSETQPEALPSVPAGDWEYIVVGSGPGGGTVAARLAELGHTVLVLEAGGDPSSLSGGNQIHPDQNTLPDDYQVPAFHPNATENDALKWDFFVRHYENTEQQKRDSKYYANYQGDPVDGVLYPRVGALGGCTAHSAMIVVYPQNADWQKIADDNGDESWTPERMRRYFEKLENCHHRPFERALKFLTGLNPTRHGFGGWLRTEKAIPVGSVIGDQPLLDTIFNGIKAALQNSGDEAAEIVEALETQLDPNDWRTVKANAVGIHYTPLSTSNHARTGARERLLDVRNRYPKRLRIEFDAVASRVLFNERNQAVGVEYRKGQKLYRPYGIPANEGETRRVLASREVILCGGAFNTPQLLMLSGIGPKDQLDRWGIKPVKVLAGVGKNLQDRYEIGVVHRLNKDFESLHGATFTKGDGPYEEWAKRRTGIYTSNGVILGVTRKSAKASLPDLFCFGLLGNFHGYFPGYSKLPAEQHDRLTWAILKAHTLNHGGEVTLKSADPLVAPNVNFHYFEEGTDKAGVDLDAVVEGIRFVRRLTAGLSFMKEELPGPAIESDDQLRSFVRDNAWGHHASCSCRIGKESDNGVLDSSFRVHGVSGLRVVDASIFPKIPGFFIVSAIYIAAEKAADVIHRSSSGRA